MTKRTINNNDNLSWLSFQMYVGGVSKRREKKRSKMNENDEK